MKRIYYIFICTVGFGIIGGLLVLLTLAGVVQMNLPSYYLWMHLTAKLAIFFGILSLLSFYAMTKDKDFKNYKDER